MKILSHEEFSDLNYSKKQAIAKVIAKKFMQELDDEALLFHLTQGLVSEYNHEGWGYDKYEEDVAWFNDVNKEMTT